MRIVIVELDAALGMFLKKGLTTEGHYVSWTDHYGEGWSLAESGAPDLMMIDVSTPGGVDLLATMHKAHRRVALFALLRSNAVEDRVRCLDAGADDCITKPFSFQELTARCRALLRRQERSEDVVLTHGDLTLNRICRSVSMDGQAVNMTVKEFRLLEYLLQNAGRCCSRGELLTEVFQLAPNNATNVVDVYINYLRKKLSNGESSPQIMTVRGAGYRLARSESPAMAPFVVERSSLRASA